MANYEIIFLHIRFVQLENDIITLDSVEMPEVFNPFPAPSFPTVFSFLGFFLAFVYS